MQRLTNVDNVDDDFLSRDSVHDDHSNLSVEFSESVSVASTGSSGSSYQQRQQASSRQQDVRNHKPIFSTFNVFLTYFFIRNYFQIVEKYEHCISDFTVVK